LTQDAETAIDYLLLFEAELEAAIDSHAVKRLRRAADRLSELLKLRDADFGEWRNRQIDSDSGAAR
jgi:hypothetical protein